MCERESETEARRIGQHARYLITKLIDTKTHLDLVQYLQNTEIDTPGISTMEIVTSTKDPKVTARASLIVVTNTFPNENLDAMLHSTGNFSFKYEIIIIWSNIRQRGEIEHYLSDWNKSLPNLVKTKIVLMDFDRGVSYGKNVGAALAGSPNLIFVDDDVIVIEDPELLLQYLEGNKCQGIQPLMLSLSRQEIIDSAGDFIKKDNRGILYIPYSRGMGDSVSDLCKDLHVEEISSMRGAFMIVRKEALWAIGGFDNAFNFGYEEVDLGWRMIIFGYRLLVVPSVRVLHRGGRSTHPKRGDEKSILMHLVNYYVMNLKVTNNLGPYILTQFYRKLLDYEIWKIRNMGADFLDAAKGMLVATRLFVERLSFVSSHKRILDRKCWSNGRHKLEELAKGRRFILEESD